MWRILEELLLPVVQWLVLRPGYWVCKLLPRYRRIEPSDRAEGWAGVAFWIVVIVGLGALGEWSSRPG